MINIPVLRWGKPYTSLETETIVHFDTGEELAKVSQGESRDHPARHAPGESCPGGA